MRMLVLGAGLQGCACAYDLLQQKAVERVTIADLNPDRAHALLKAQIDPQQFPRSCPNRTNAIL